MADRGKGGYNAGGHSISVGANPTATFPNSHLTMHLPRPAAVARDGNSDGGSVWSQPQPMAAEASVLTQLQQAVASEDWAKVFAEQKTQIQAEAKWSATADRCATLQCLCTMSKAQNVLEIGSFCGAASLAMAEALPQDGKVVALELEPYFVEFGKTYRQKSKAGSKIETKIGAAVESLKDLVAEITDGDRNPFDFVVIDCDKSSMAEYLQYVRKPYFLSERGIVCMDVTPFKGQAPTRFTRFGAEDQWKTKSGEEEIAALRKSVAALAEYTAHEFGGLLVIQRRPQDRVSAQAEASPVDRDSDDEEGGKGRAEEDSDRD